MKLIASLVTPLDVLDRLTLAADGRNGGLSWEAADFEVSHYLTKRGSPPPEFCPHDVSLAPWSLPLPPQGKGLVSFSKRIKFSPPRFYNHASLFFAFQVEPV